jgi:hypothetical protein
MKIIILCLTVIVLINSILSQISTVQNYSDMKGVQVYLMTQSSAFFYSTLTGNSTSITVQANLYLPTTQASIDSSSGLYSAVGFGSRRMDGQDIILFTYSKGVFGCSDYYSPGDYINSDIALGGINDVTMISNQIAALNTNFSPYLTLISWTCTKDISNPEKYDWSDFQNWQTNKGPISGTWNYISSNGTPQQHAQEPKVYTITDGAGLSGNSSNGSKNLNGYKMSCLIALLFIIFY